MRRKPKRPFDSEPSENEDREPSSGLAEGRANYRGAVQTRNRGKRTVRYREDSEDEAKKRGKGEQRTGNASSGRGQTKRPLEVEDDDDEDDDDDENEDPRARRRENGNAKRYSGRQSAKEAVKRMRSDFASSSEGEEVAVPTYSVSSRGRVRKIIHTSNHEFFD